MQMMGISSLLCLLEFQQPQQPPSVASHSPLIAAGLGLDPPPVQRGNTPGSLWSSATDGVEREGRSYSVRCLSME